MESKIYLRDVVENVDRKFGASKTYYPFAVEDLSGNIRIAMLTATELTAAMKRGEANKEDLSKPVLIKERSVFERFSLWFRGT